MEPMKRVELGKYVRFAHRRLRLTVVSDPAICHGKLTFEGTRVLVGPVLAAFAQGCSKEEILENWPTITWEAVHEAQMLAVEKLIVDYPGAPQPWEERVAKEIEERERKRQLRAQRRQALHEVSGGLLRKPLSKRTEPSEQKKAEKTD